MGNRIYRWTTAYGGNKFNVPVAMLDSGKSWKNGQYNNGSIDDYYQLYKGLVETALDRGPKGEVHASSVQVNNHFESDVLVKNLTGMALGSANSATVNVIVYEDVVVPNPLPTNPETLTSRIVRAATGSAINTSLENGRFARYKMVTPDLVNVKDWTKLHTIIFVDYRPLGTTGSYDIMQAAFAEPSGVAIQTSQLDPKKLDFLVDFDHPVDQKATVEILGFPSNSTWTISENIGWLTLSKISGTINSSVTVTVSANSLPRGLSTGTITVRVTCLGTTYEQVIPVSAYRDPVKLYHLPYLGNQ